METRNRTEVQQGARASAGKGFRAMLDNFPPAMLGEGLRILHGVFETEASGGIHLGNILDYAAT